MPELLALLGGVIVTIMNGVNAGLQSLFGDSAAVMLIHMVGLICIFPFAWRKIDLHQGIPWYFWSGGLIGVLTIVFSNIAFSTLSMTLATAAALSGQTATSLWIDTAGILGSRKIPFDWRRIVSLVFILAGTGAIVLWG